MTKEQKKAAKQRAMRIKHTMEVIRTTCSACALSANLWVIYHVYLSK